MINSASYINSNLILDVLHNLHVMRFDLQSDKNTPHRDIGQGAAGCTPTDDFQGHGLQHLFNQCPDNIGKADVFETNYRWEHLIYSCTPTDEIGFDCLCVPHLHC